MRSFVEWEFNWGRVCFVKLEWFSWVLLVTAILGVLSALHQSYRSIKMCMNFYAVRRGATEDAATVLRDKPHLKAIPELDGEGRILSIARVINLWLNS